MSTFSHEVLPPSAWGGSIARQYPTNPLLRDVVHETVVEWRERDLVTDLEICSRTLSNSPTVGPRVAAESRNFGAMSWRRMHLYANRLSDAHVQDFTTFATEEFRRYARDIDMELSSLTQNDWDWYCRSTFAWLLVGVLENPKHQLAFGINPRRLKWQRSWRAALARLGVRPY